MNIPLVVQDAVRPAVKPGECFYCNALLGTPHNEGCVYPQRKVRLRVTLEYTQEVPMFWDQHSIEFHRNEGSWCASNFVDDLKKYDEGLGENRCICNDFKCEYIGEVVE
jgi:hypothetical protein